MKVRYVTTLLAAMATMAAGQTAFAQSPFTRPDAVEVKRVGAMATVHRLARPARSSFDPHVAWSGGGADPKHSTGGGDCNINIGDLASAREADGLGQPVARKGLQSFEYITIVDATPICVMR